MKVSHLGALALALFLLASPALAFWHGVASGGGGGNAFQGNPNVVVSAISTSPTPISFTANTTSGSLTITPTSTTSGAQLGMVCTGTGLDPTNPTTIYAVNGTTSMYLSTPAASNQTGTTITCGSNPIYGNRFTCQGAAIVAASPPASAINTGGCFIQVSADGVSATGTNAVGIGVRPWQDLEYCWDFGDPSGTEIFTRPTDGASVNANNQCGPEAAYVYRTAGTKTITLTIRGRNGGTPTSPTFLTATTTQSVIVTNFNTSGGVIYADSQAGGTNSGTATNPCNTMACVNSFLGTSNATFVFAQGSNFSGGLNSSSPGTNVAFSNIRIGQYVGASGPGAKPIITATGNASAIGIDSTSGSFFNPTANGTKSDIVVSNLKLTNAIGWTPSLALVGFAYGNIGNVHMDNVYFDNVDAIVVGQSSASSGYGVYSSGVLTTPDVGTWEGWGWWGGSAQTPLTYYQFTGSVTGNVLTVTCPCTGTGVEVGMGINSAGIPALNAQYIVSSAGVNQWNITPFAAWSSATAYNLGQTVVSAGVDYVSLTGFGNTNQTPASSPTFWQVIGSVATVVGGDNRHTFFGGPPDWNFIQGVTFSGNDSVFDVPPQGRIHFIYPETQAHNLYKWINFAATGPGGTIGLQYNYCINGNSNFNSMQNLANQGQVRWWLVSELRCGDSTRPPLLFMDMSDVNNSAVGSQFQDVVIEKNAIVGTTQGGAWTPTENNQGVTWRDNRAWGGAGAGTLTSISANTSGTFVFQAYRNKTYTPSSVGGGAVTFTQDNYSVTANFHASNFYDVLGGNCPTATQTKVYFTGAAAPLNNGRTNPYFVVSSGFGNLCQISTTLGGSVTTTPSSGNAQISQIWNAPFAVTDNFFDDDRTTPQAFKAAFGDDNGVNGATSLFDRNTYCAPNGGSTPTWWFDNIAGAAQSYSVWSTAPNNHDANSTVLQTKCPGWNTPVTQWSDMGP